MLVDELVRVGFAAVGVTQPSAAVRDDVVGTLPAAIADPDVAARLGRLSKAERWSGFGEFGVSSAVGTDVRRDTSPAQPKPPHDHATEQAGQRQAAERRRATAAAELEVAKAAHEDAAETVAERRGKVATARRRYEKLLETLSAAEQELDNADSELDALSSPCTARRNR